MSTSQPQVRATEIGEYIRHHSCERRFRLAFNNRELADSVPFYYQLSSTMDPVLQEAGKQREQEWEASIRGAGLADLCRYDLRPNEESTTWNALLGEMTALAAGKAAFGREIDVRGPIGAFEVSGRIDFVLLLWREGKPYLRLVECKASRKDRTYHRVQLVLYRLLVRDLLTANPLTLHGHTIDPDAIECVVARIDENTNSVHDILALPALDLDMEEADVTRLLAANGALTRILATPLDTLPYQLNSSCDDCALHIHCFPETARQRRLELLGIDPSAVRTLRAAGISSLDALAECDANSPAVTKVRADPAFTTSFDLLQHKARARRRTLPGGADNPDDHEVIALPNRSVGQLPQHTIGTKRLVRIFLSISFDYAENRVGAIAAHVTRSDQPLSTLFEQSSGKFVSDPDVKEQWSIGKDGQGKTIWESRLAKGIDLVGVLPRPWSGDFEKDTGREADLLQRFFNKIVEAIQTVCEGEEHAPIHFYVWSRQEITRLIEACSRTDTDLLGSLRQLLGCRDSLEQLIYSCLSDEVDTRYALGWTGRGLIVAAGLKWYGRRFHWTRRIGSEVIALDKVFRADLFDYKTTLKFDAQGNWLPLDADTGNKHTFEVRSCFEDALPAPYWRAYWNTLPDPANPALPPKMAQTIRTYQQAGQPGYLKAYLKARVQALRWIEESVKFKNEEIAKPFLRISDLPKFTLGVDNTARAALDFLWLDQHVKVNDWIAAHLSPPTNRVPLGRTIPLTDVRVIANNRLAAVIDLTGFPLTRQALETRCSFDVGAFVRLSPCADDPQQGQTIGQLMRGGSTCSIKSLDWKTGKIELGVIPFTSRADRYLLASRAWQEGDAGYTHATLDESPSDFVGGKIDYRLQSPHGAYVYQWFDPKHADIPPQVVLPKAQQETYTALLQGMPLEKGPLAPDQVRAAVEGLSARIQLLQGPPGTGKTQTTAAATLLRILARRRPGDIVLVAANTHTAVNTLLTRIAELLPVFESYANAQGHAFPRVKISKVISSPDQAIPQTDIHTFLPSPSAETVNDLRADGVLIIGGTPNPVLKMARELSGRQPFSKSIHRFQVPVLIVDEASMMVQPYFLALASLVTEEGEILLAGDHRQLAPIIAHDWETEDRPPTVLYQPYVSAYEAIRNLKHNQAVPDSAILSSALSFTFRLPPAIRDLIARLYRQDAIELAGLPSSPIRACPPAVGCWDSLWQQEAGLFLITHTERESKQSNLLEAQIISELLQAAPALAAGSVGIVMPHRAQRSLLKATLMGTGLEEAVDVIDTVERLQGGERETIVVSATASDPVAIAARAEFILSLNRANVAFSRAKKRLIVVCAESLLSHIAPELKSYSAAMLWKALRALCCEPLSQVQKGGHDVTLWTLPSQEQPIEF